MECYLSYKDSGVEWIGEIPEHWKSMRLKDVALMRAKKHQDESLTYTGLENIESWTGRYIPSSDGAFADSDGLYFEAGWVLFGKLRPYLAKAFLAESKGQCSSEFLVFEPTEVLPKYFFYSLLQARFIDYVNSTTYGTKMPRANWSIIGSTRYHCPSQSEQEAISNFLDRKTSEIDALISDTEKSIELLGEYKKSVISEAVAKGLDPNVPMKDSGVERIGEIPEEWEVKKLKYIANNPLMYGANESAELDDTNLPRYIRITDIDENGNLKADTFKSLTVDRAKPYLLKTGDILFARSGASVGKTYLHESSEPACFAGYLIKLEVNTKIADRKFVYYNTSTGRYKNWIKANTIQATIQNVSAEKYNNYEIALPPISEQMEIADYLDYKADQIDALTSDITEQVKKLKEYRQAVVSEMVTGKFKVSGVDVA